MTFDYALVGGGLANGLLALALRAKRPDVRLAMVEKSETLGGRHTWCFHGTDVDDETLSWLQPLVVRRWRGYDVRFPGASRTLTGDYLATTSESLDRAVRRALDGRGRVLITGATATHVGPSHVVLDDGRVLDAQVVLDARGPQPQSHWESTGFQKFVGLDVVFARPHGMSRPLLMDAAVAQTDGFRFMYVLPWDEHRLLIEDTVFSNHPRMDTDQLRTRIVGYAREMGFGPPIVLREEHGCLPMPWGEPVFASLASPLRLGYQAGWFHPATGYSLPVAARVANAVADHVPADAAEALVVVARRHRRRTRFFRTLNRFLFQAIPPEQRRDVLARFYRLPEGTIQRFYALETTALDKARIVARRPMAGLSWRSLLFPQEAA